MTAESGKGWTMHHGDCIDVMPTLGKVDAVVTDPPYGINIGSADQRGGPHGLAKGAAYDDSYELFVDHVVPRINMAIDVANRSLVWTGPHIHEQRKPDAIGGVYCPSALGRTRWGFKNLLPVLFYGCSRSVGMGKGATEPTVIMSTEVASTDEHPVAKPIGWMLWSVRLASAEGDTILDPFTGSGTTGVAALRLGRRFIGIEKDEKYFRLACDRLRAEEQGSTLQAARAGQGALFK